MRKWERQFKVYHSLWEELAEQRETGESDLRFDRSFIIASDIAEQYFCEKKVELQYLYGEVETEEKSIGTEGHEKLLEDQCRLTEKSFGRKSMEKS